MKPKVGDRVLCTPDPLFFSDPGDYAYVTRPDSSCNGKVLTVQDILPPSPQVAGLPRSGVTTYRLVDDSGFACWLAVESEMQEVSDGE